MTPVRAPGATRAVLFDAVGTLIHADPPVAQVYRSTARSHGVAISLDVITSRIDDAIDAHFSQRVESSEAIERARWSAIVMDVFRESPERVEAIFADLWQHFASPTAWRLYDDVEACLARLQAEGLHVAIASNFDARLRMVCAGHVTLKSLDIFCSSELGFAKPHEQFFRCVEQRLEIPPHALTMVGDDVACDHGGALAAGWNAVHLERCGGLEGALMSLTELPELLATP